jgi:hypothetical protein
MGQMAIEMSGSRLESVINTVLIVIIGEDLLNGSNTMKMPSQNWLYLGKRLGMMMKSRSVCLYRMPMPSDLISNIRKKLQDRFTILANYPIEPKG